jgi:hypothetical protein
VGTIVPLYCFSRRPVSTASCQRFTNSGPRGFSRFTLVSVMTCVAIFALERRWKFYRTICTLLIHIAKKKST